MHDRKKILFLNLKRIQNSLAKKFQYHINKTKKKITCRIFSIKERKKKILRKQTF